jgi:cobalt-zinc-cadmium resistance protein CzcA
MVGGLLTSTAFTLLALPTFYSFVHHARTKREQRRAASGTVPT